MLDTFLVALVILAIYIYVDLLDTYQGR